MQSAGEQSKSKVKSEVKAVKLRALALCMMCLAVATAALAAPITGPELCSGGFGTFTMPETGLETATLTCTGFNFSPQVVAFIEPGTTTLSDVAVIVPFVTGVGATIVFQSDPASLEPPPTGATFVPEPGTFTAIGTSPTGAHVALTFFSDLNEGPSTSDFIRVPEPATLAMLGAGLILIASRLRRKHLPHASA
jgi:PEP-CTERM motif